MIRESTKNNIINNLPKGWCFLYDTIDKGKRRIKIKCDKGHTIIRSIYRVMKSTSCEECTKNKVRKNLPDGWSFIKIISNSTIRKAKILCKNRHIIYKNIQKLKNTSFCEECFNLNRVEKINKSNMLPSNWVCLDVFKEGIYTKAKIRCNNNHEFIKELWGMRNNHYCKECKNKTYYEKLVNKVEHKFRGRVLSKTFISAHSEYEFLCFRGHEFKAMYYNVMNGKWCDTCSSNSRGEGVIREYIISNNFRFKEQKKFNDCKDKTHLRFDFYLPDYNMCIEYQGIQHYCEVDFWEGKKGFEERKKRDLIKRDYCKANNIKLIEIPYTKFDNISKILKLELIKKIVLDK